MSKYAPGSPSKENANRKNIAAGQIFALGSQQKKQAIRRYLSTSQRQALEENCLYIHDEEYFDLSLNCLSLSLKQLFKEPLLFNGVQQDRPSSVGDLFTQLLIALINIENEVSGGLTLVNFDQELADYCEENNLPLDYDAAVLWLRHIFNVINFGNSRVDQSPYISFSIGALKTGLGAMVCDALLMVLAEGTAGHKPFIFPNVQFRVKGAINGQPDAPFYAQYQHALQVTARQMNPTYLLGDSPMNQSVDLDDLHVVGCRSRLLESRAGEQATGINRTNIGAVAINLPRLALMARTEEQLYPLLDCYFADAGAMLLKKAELLNSCLADNAPTLISNNLLYPYSEKVEDVISNASLSIGFIGGAELCAQLLPGGDDSERDALLQRVLTYLRELCQQWSRQYDRIFTLIGVSGEGLCYKFIQKDAGLIDAAGEALTDEQQKLYGKGFYTNSFHLPVELKLPLSQKVAREGRYHALCHGGGISYVEISHLESNAEGLEDVITLATAANINYLGFNFDKNMCNSCGESTLSASECGHCGSRHVTKIRRVSGYLGYMDSFSHGKALEEQVRVKHTLINRAEQETFRKE